MQAELEKAVASQKVKWGIKITEAQTIQVETPANPEPPTDAVQAQAMRILIERGPTGPIIVPADAFEALVVSGKASKSWSKQGDILYTLVSVMKKVDSPYKGQTPGAWSQPKVTRKIREDGKEEWTIDCEAEAE